MTNTPINVISAEDLGDFQLRLVFNDGATQTVNFKPFLEQSHHPQIRAYLDPARFASFQIVFGDLVWGDSELCFPVMDLYKNTITHRPSLARAA